MSDPSPLSTEQGAESLSAAPPVGSVASGGSARWTLIGLALVLVGLIVGGSMLCTRRLTAYHDPLTLWQDAALHEPDNALIHTNLGDVLFEAGHREEALAEYRLALRLNNGYAVAHCNLANALFRLGQYEEARTSFQRVLKIEPDNAEAHNNLGTVLIQLDRPQEAITAFREALRLRPRFLDAECNLGAALLKAGDAQGSLEHLEAAVRLKADCPLVWVNLASAHADLHHRHDALAAGEKAAQLARAQGQNDLATHMETWVAAYRADGTQAPDLPPSALPPSMP